MDANGAAARAGEERTITVKRGSRLLQEDGAVHGPEVTVIGQARNGANDGIRSGAVCGERRRAHGRRASCPKIEITHRLVPEPSAHQQPVIGVALEGAPRGYDGHVHQPSTRNQSRLARADQCENTVGRTWRAQGGQGVQLNIVELPYRVVFRHPWKA